MPSPAESFPGHVYPPPGPEHAADHSDQCGYCHDMLGSFDGCVLYPEGGVASGWSERICDSCADDLRQCDHWPRGSRCVTVLPAGFMVAVHSSSLSDLLVCEGCADAYYSMCDGCDRMVPDTDFADAYCDRCQAEDEDAHGGYDTSDEDDCDAPLVVLDDIEPTGRLVFRNVPGRPVRLVSWEQEIGRGGNAAAGVLYAHGLAPWETLSDYHGHRPESAVVIPERDSSCGGELIYQRVRLWDDVHARQAERAALLVRALRRDGTVSLDHRCGCHVHVDASAPVRLSRAGAEGLYRAFCHVEDVLYVLASAGWRNGHRCEPGDGYAPSLRKFPEGHPFPDVYRYLVGSRAGLNLGPYLHSLQSCHCGAVVCGEWEQCRCTLNRPTVEFRLWNGTTNPVKLRAYIALSMGLVSLACDASALPRLKGLPVNEWAGNDAHPDASGWADQLAWIGRNVPMQDEDRAALVYTAEQSRLADVLSPDTIRECVNARALATV